MPRSDNFWSRGQPRQGPARLAPTHWRPTGQRWQVDRNSLSALEVYEALTLQKGVRYPLQWRGPQRCNAMSCSGSACWDSLCRDVPHRYPGVGAPPVSNPNQVPLSTSPGHRPWCGKAAPINWVPLGRQHSKSRLAMALPFEVLIDDGTRHRAFGGGPLLARGTGRGLKADLEPRSKPSRPSRRLTPQGTDNYASSSGTPGALLHKHHRVGGQTPAVREGQWSVCRNWSSIVEVTCAGQLTPDDRSGLCHWPARAVQLVAQGK